MTRPSWDSYFMDLAFMAANRSTCALRSVGAILVRENILLSTGYNGVPRKLPHCRHKDLKNEKCPTSVHAEINAILFSTGQLRGDVIYTTTAPCLDCAKALVNYQIERVVYGEERRNGSHEGPALLEMAGVTVERLR
jgi:dCMP deaminase